MKKSPKPTTKVRRGTFSASDCRDIYAALMDAANIHHSGPTADRYIALARRIREENDSMKARLIDALQLPEVLDGSKWLRLPVPMLGTGRETTDHDLLTMTVGADPARCKMYYCDRISDPRAMCPTYFGTEAAFTLDRLLGECTIVDAKKGGAA